MSKCAKESPYRFINGNTTGRIKSASQVRTLKFEAKQEKAKMDGIHPTNDMNDCLRTMSNIVTKDVSTRHDRRDDGNDVLTGIVRRCAFVPTSNESNTPAVAPDIILHERSLCALFGEVCESCKCVISLDSTGHMVNFKDTDFDGKVLHTMMMLQYRESRITRQQNQFSRGDDFTSIRLSERISSWNTATAICSWLNQLMEDVEIATESIVGRRITPKIGMLRCDNALQLVTGPIMALRLPNHIDSAKGYNNISLILLIQHESRTSSVNGSVNGERMDNKTSCMLVMSRLEQYSPTAITICNVHTYLYRRDGYKRMKTKPKSLKGYYTGVNRLYGNVAHAFMRERSVTRLLVRKALLIAIFERERIPCMKIGVNTKACAGHDKNKAKNMAQAMDDLVKRGINMLYESISEHGDSLIAEELRQVGNTDRQRFRGGTNIAGDMLRMVSDTLVFSLTYPVHVDRAEKEATIRTLIIYSPYDFCTNGSWDIEVQPKIIGGFEKEVSLPYNKGSIENPLCASELASYWKKEMNRTGLNSAAISQVAGTAWDRVLFDSNMSLEAHLNDLHNRNSRHKRSLKNIPSFMMGRWDDTVETAAYTSNQIRVQPEKRKRRQEQAAARTVGTTMREEDKESVWRRDDKETSGVLKEKFERMIKVLKAAMHQERDSKDSNEYVFDRKNIKSMFEVLEYVSTKSDLGTNLSKKKFYEWHNGQRKKMLPDEFDQLIDGMYDKYVIGAEKRMKEVSRRVLNGSERKYKPQRILTESVEDGCDYEVVWTDGSVTHEPQSNIADTGVIDIYDWDIDAKAKLKRLDRCYPKIVTIRHQIGESLVDLGSDNVNWRRRAYVDTKSTQALPSEGDTIYIMFKKAGNIEVRCVIAMIPETKRAAKRSRK